MSDVKLYTADECQPALGLFVRASDHDALRLEAGSLRGSCKALGDENKHLKRETKRQSKAIAALTAERDRLRDDAERYAHLKAAWDDDVLISYLDSNVHPSDWDSVIDAAMAAKEA